MNDPEGQSRRARKDAQRYEDEQIFLRELGRALQMELEERRLRRMEDHPPEVPLPPGEASLERVWRRELEIIAGAEAAISSEPLEQVLRQWLRRIQRRAMELAAQPRAHASYSPEYWQCETDRLVLTDLLRRWWEWQGGPQKTGKDAGWGR